MARLRLYAVVRNLRRTPALPRGLEGERLSRLRHGRLVIVAGTETKPVTPTREHLLAYDRIVRAVAAASTAILPARFGTIAESRAALKAEVRDRAKELNRTLNLVAGRVQMTLRLPAVAAARRPKPSTGRDYLRALSDALPENSPHVMKVRRSVKTLVRAEHVSTNQRGIVVYHLIEARDVPQYLRRARTHASGPFPPYAFALYSAPGESH